MSTRAAMVAGQFYSADPQQLSAEVEEFLSIHSPRTGRRAQAKAVVCPHAGYVYSGGVAGQVYASIEPPDTAILIGPDHFGVARDFSVYPEGVWQTPLGEVRVASEVSGVLLQKCAWLSDDPRGHRRDHCLEVQLPFLQKLNPYVQIVPVLVGTMEVDKLRALGDSLGDALAEMAPRPLLVASSDMNHQEPVEVSQSKDRRAIQAMLKLDEDKLWEECVRHNITMCGMGAAYVALRAAKRLGACKAELIDYRTSADAGGPEDAVVGYAGIVIW